MDAPLVRPADAVSPPATVRPIPAHGTRPPTRPGTHPRRRPSIRLPAPPSRPPTGPATGRRRTGRGSTDGSPSGHLPTVWARARVSSSRSRGRPRSPVGSRPARGRPSGPRTRRPGGRGTGRWRTGPGPAARLPDAPGEGGIAQGKERILDPAAGQPRPRPDHGPDNDGIVVPPLDQRQPRDAGQHLSGAGIEGPVDPEGQGLSYHRSRLGQVSRGQLRSPKRGAGRGRQPRRPLRRSWSMHSRYSSRARSGRPAATATSPPLPSAIQSTRPCPIVRAIRSDSAARLVARSIRFRRRPGPPVGQHQRVDGRHHGAPHRAPRSAGRGRNGVARPPEIQERRGAQRLHAVDRRSGRSDGAGRRSSASSQLRPSSSRCENQ